MSTWSKEEKLAIIRYNFSQVLSVDQRFKEMSVMEEHCPRQTTILRLFSLLVQFEG